MIPTTQQLFDFVDFYATTTRPARARTRRARRPRRPTRRRCSFNIETKLNPRSDRDYHNNVYADRTPDPETITQAVAGVIEKQRHAGPRATSSRSTSGTLRIVQREFPNLQTVALFGDYPVYGDTRSASSGDGTNLQPQGAEANTRWLAGLYWPYRETAQDNPFRVQTSGGFEGMAIPPDGKTLLPMLEKPLTAATQDRTTVYEFDLKTGGYTGDTWSYKYRAKRRLGADFILFDDKHGIAIERDNTQGDLERVQGARGGHARQPGHVVKKSLAADLMDIRDPRDLAAGACRATSALGNPFAFPFQTIEDVVNFLDKTTVLVINDNNFPFSIGRHRGPGSPTTTSSSCSSCRSR